MGKSEAKSGRQIGQKALLLELRNIIKMMYWNLDYNVFNT